MYPHPKQEPPSSCSAQIKWKTVSSPMIITAFSPAFTFLERLPAMLTKVKPVCTVEQLDFVLLLMKRKQSRKKQTNKRLNWLKALQCHWVVVRYLSHEFLISLRTGPSFIYSTLMASRSH